MCLVPQKRGRSEARKAPFILYVPIAKTHFGEIVGGGYSPASPRDFPKNGLGAEPEKRNLSCRFLLGKHIFVKSWGGGISHAQGLSPPMISPKSVFARGNYKINVGVVSGAPL